MKKLLKQLRNNRGFTLVELLIVIAIIGILAIAIIAALDPIEQLKKARDTGRLADIKEIHSAMTRYYASFGCFPDERDYGTSDGDAAGVCANAAWPVAPAVANANTAVANDVYDWTLLELIASGEVKTSLDEKPNSVNGQYFVRHDANGVPQTCFIPESRAGRNGGIGPLFEPDLVTAGACVINAAFDSTYPVLATDPATCVVCVD